MDFQEVPKRLSEEAGVVCRKDSSGTRDGLHADLQTCMQVCGSGVMARDETTPSELDWRTTAHRRAHPPNAEPQAELALNGVVEVARNWLRRICTW